MNHTVVDYVCATDVKERERERKKERKKERKRKKKVFVCVRGSWILEELFVVYFASATEESVCACEGETESERERKRERVAVDV